MAVFYNQKDQDIYKTNKFMPQSRFLFDTPTNTPVVEEEETESFGIPQTKAFTNSGGNSFNQLGNAFGYGSPVSEVNVRTFNPQSNDPTGSVASAQEAYNQFGDIKDKSIYSNYADINNQIMDNRQNYQANYNSPYDDTVDLGFRGRDTSTSIQRKKGMLGKAVDTITDFMPGIGTIKRGAKFIKGMLPDNPNGPGGGSYGVAGLSDAQKEAYNTLARDGMLFSGSTGMKTLTGKNFTGKGYMEGQLDMYNKTQKKQGKSFADMTDEEIAALTGFQKKQYLESSALFKEKIATQKALRQDYLDRQQGLIGTRGTDGRSSSIIQGEGGGNTAGTSRPSDHGSVGLGHNAGSVRGAMNDNDPSTGSAQGHNQNLRSGGRAGYFFGGRVNFKNGGLASIL